MGNPPLPEHLRNLIKYDFEQGDKNCEIEEKRGVPIRTIQRYRKSWEDYGEVLVPAGHGGGRPRKISSFYQDQIRLFYEWKPTAYLDEVCWYLYDEYDVEACEATVYNALTRIGWSRKKATKQAQERNQTLRNLFFARMSQYRSDQLIFLDESAANERTADRKYGFSPQGTPVNLSEPLKRSKRWSILPAYTLDGYIACVIHQGSITAAIFLDFIKNRVLPQCSGGGYGPRSVLVLDNASIHHSQELKDMCEEAGVILEYLPPYSPDFNPIEMSFSVLKAWIRAHQEEALLYERSLHLGGFGQFLKAAVDRLDNAWSAEATFRKCGYAT